MAELVAEVERLAQIDPQLHWFCPRTHKDDSEVYYDEDYPQGVNTATGEIKATKLAKIEETESLKHSVLIACQILAFDGDDAIPYQEKLKRKLVEQLGRCDICVREYHRSRDWLEEQLHGSYPAEEVMEFLKKYDDLNKARIVTGLNNATETLLDIPPQERNILAAGDEGMYAIFEAFHCRPFLNDEMILQKSFDRPFGLIQTKKKIVLPNFAPGTIGFLFSTDPDRRAWAERNTTKMKRQLLSSEFEYAVKPFLQQALGRVNIISLEKEFLPRFWRATRQIVSRMTRDLVRNNLRAMEANIYTIGLEHFQIDDTHFVDLMDTYGMLLELDGESFWAAMGSVSPQNVIETICRAPGLESLLKNKQERSNGQQAYLNKELSWIVAFVKSIQAANLVPPLRTVLDLCLRKYQGDSYPHYTSTVAMDKGLQSLLDGCRKIMTDVDGGPVFTHLIEAVAKDYMSVLLQELDGIEKKEEMQITSTQHLSLQIIEVILAMDIKGLARDRRIIERTLDLDHEIGLSSLNVWKLSMRHIKPGRPALVMAILSGITPLLPLEPILPKQAKAAQKSADSWNNALNRVIGYVSTDLLDRLEGFSPDELLDLFQEASAAKGIMSLLFNSNDKIHKGALGILKTLSGEDIRRDSLLHVIRVFRGTALTAVSHSLRQIRATQVFGPCSNMLKLCSDILSCLCDTQDGVLRTEIMSQDQDLVALRIFWKDTWEALGTIFDKTEAWSSLGHDKSMMQEFCRDTMDLAESAFDQYAVIAGTLQEGEKEQESAETARKLLQVPKKVFANIVKWLRLRDEYLISKAVSLTAKMLGRLQEVGIRITDESAQYLEDIVTRNNKNTKVKTKLTMNDKAQVQEALEHHLGESLSVQAGPDPVPTKKQQSSLQNWASSGSGRDRKPEASTTKTSKSVIDLQKWSAAADKNRAQDAKPMQKVPSLAQQKATMRQKEEQNSFLLKRKAAQAEKEKQKQAAIARANLGAGSGVTGIGNLGKDHSTPGQTVMVDDDDLDQDDEDDDDDLDDDLFGDNNKVKKAHRAQFDVSGTIGLKPEVKIGPTRIQRTARSAKDMRARLKPDLSSLHHIILAWDYFHDGDFPPGSSEDNFSRVSDVFKDPTSYQETFEPLLTLEAWQGLVKERGENSSKPYEIQVKNRTNVDRFIEVSSFIGHLENRDLQLTEGDIVLLSTAKKPADDREAPHCLARIYRAKRQKQQIEIVYQVLPGSTLAAKLTPQAVMFGLKVQSITPLEREYGALRSLQYYDLCSQIVKAQPSPRIKFSERQISQVQDVYNLNRAQAEAVNAALENDGFSLIQGPPGTGKTGTIVAMIGGLLSPILSNHAKGATSINVPRPNGATNGMSGASDAPSRKLLVCAPSNAAVDEIVGRLLRKGVYTKSGTQHNINVVRIGRADRVSNPQVAEVTMERLLEKKTSGEGQDPKQRERNAELFKEHSQVSEQLRTVRAQLDAHDSNQQMMDAAERKRLDDSMTHLRRRKNELGTRIDNVKDQERNQGREKEMNMKRARQAVIDEAHVICATLSGSGHDMFSSLNVEFETVIIDEAAQCVEASSLIPLKYGCTKCIMVGDPKQLPPTVFSKEAAKFQYEQSLFVRMQNKHEDDVHLLDTQYRMHPDISLFPSRNFYDSMLMDGPGMAASTKQPWHASSLLAPYRFFDVKGQHRAGASGASLINVAEIEVAMAIYDRLMRDFKKIYDFSQDGERIGVITTYKAQLNEMKKRFVNKFGEGVNDFVEFNTTDAFQGRECRVIIFSCVRASPSGGIGFLQDIRRMNVGLTRAKSSLWVLGNSDSLVQGAYWRKLIEDAKARDSYTTGNLHDMFSRPSSDFAASGSGNQSMLDINSHRADMAREQARRSERADVDMRDAPPALSRQTSEVDVEMDDRSSNVDHVREGPATKKRTFGAASMDGSSEMQPAARRSLTPASAGDRYSAPGSRSGTPSSNAGGMGQQGQQTNGTAKPPMLMKKKPAGAGLFIPKKTPKTPNR